MKMALRSMKFDTSAAAGLKSGQSNRKRDLGNVKGSAIPERRARRDLLNKKYRFL
jgi:hypothetical protein